jgi:hypothetical protein
MQVSEPYAAFVRSGRRRPRPRHWQTLAGLAGDGHNCLAMVVRGQRETLVRLLTRLDQAIDKPLTEDVYTQIGGI